MPQEHQPDSAKTIESWGCTTIVDRAAFSAKSVVGGLVLLSEKQVPLPDGVGQDRTPTSAEAWLLHSASIFGDIRAS